MTHLGSRLSALVDGQLTPAESERALEHVARCQACATELAAQRDARRTLSRAAVVEPTPDLTARLLALSAQQPPAPVEAPWDTPSRELPTGEWCGAVGGHGARRRVVALAVGGVGVVAVGLFALGSPQVVTPDVHRVDPMAVLANAAPPTVPATSESTSLDSLEQDGWAGPIELPQDVTVSAVRTTDTAVEIDLTTPDGDVVVREQPGRLDTVALARFPTKDVRDRTVYVLSTAPWHVVWQSGDVVVDVVAPGGSDEVADLVATFPDRDYDAGVPARISRGWTTMTGALGTS